MRSFHPALLPARMSASLSSRTPPPSLGPFRLTRRLGQGGFAQVWHAEEVYEGKKLRDVAVKLFFLPSDIEPASDDAAQHNIYTALASTPDVTKPITFRRGGLRWVMAVGRNASAPPTSAGDRITTIPSRPDRVAPLALPGEDERHGRLRHAAAARDIDARDRLPVVHVALIHP